MANAQMKNTAEDMRAATEQGMHQAQKGVESFIGAAEEQARAATAGATDLGQKVWRSQSEISPPRSSSANA
jgi:hypothetical protein